MGTRKFSSLFTLVLHLLALSLLRRGFLMYSIAPRLLAKYRNYPFFCRGNIFGRHLSSKNLLYEYSYTKNFLHWSFIIRQVADGHSFYWSWQQRTCTCTWHWRWWVLQSVSKLSNSRCLSLLEVAYHTPASCSYPVQLLSKPRWTWTLLASRMHIRNFFIGSVFGWLHPSEIYSLQNIFIQKLSERKKG